MFLLPNLMFTPFEGLGGLFKVLQTMGKNVWTNFLAILVFGMMELSASILCFAKSFELIAFNNLKRVVAQVEALPLELEGCRHSARLSEPISSRGFRCPSNPNKITKWLTLGVSFSMARNCGS